MNRVNIMQLFKIFFIWFAAVILLTGCGATTGPIKAYDEGTQADTGNIGILYLPAEIELLEIDGKEVSSPYIQTGYNEVHFLPGKHALAVKYVQYWGDQISGGMVRSDPVIFKFEIKDKEQYYLRFEKPKDQWEALKIAKRFNPWLEARNAPGKTVKSEQMFDKSLTSSNFANLSDNQKAATRPLNELKFWWTKASHDEKQEFQKWLKEE